jgi:hypothetical protein
MTILSLFLGIVISLQQGRTTVTLAWDPSEYADYYTLTVDDMGQINAGCCQVSVIVSRGWHTYSLTASNESGTSEPTILRARVK